MRILTTTCSFLLALATMSSAHAGDEANKGNKKCDGKHHQEMLAKFDANHDGKLDDSEKAAARAAASARIKEKHPEAFAKFDADHDGTLSKDEMKALRAAHKEHCKDKKAEKTNG